MALSMPAISLPLWNEYGGVFVKATVKTPFFTVEILCAGVQDAATFVPLVPPEPQAASASAATANANMPRRGSTVVFIGPPTIGDIGAVRCASTVDVNIQHYLF